MCSTRKRTCQERRRTGSRNEKQKGHGRNCPGKGGMRSKRDTVREEFGDLETGVVSLARVNDFE